MDKMGIYLREENEYVGPFHTRGDAERFLTLMELSGENCDGIEIVEFHNNEVAVMADLRLVGDNRSA